MEYKQETKEFSIDLIKPYWKNVKVGNNVDIVAKSIKRFGYNNYIEVDEENVIINGHSRYKALKQLGYTKIKVNIIYDMPIKESQAYRIVDNKVAESNEWNLENLKIEIRQVGETEDMQEFFDDLDIEKFITDDIGQGFQDITSGDIEKTEGKLDNRFESTNESNYEGQQSVQVICPSCFNEFEVRK